MKVKTTTTTKNYQCTFHLYLYLYSFRKHFILLYGYIPSVHTSVHFQTHFNCIVLSDNVCALVLYKMV